MATNFPTSADDATTVGGDSLPAAGTALSDSTAGHPSHSDLHENVGDAVQAVEAKVGTGSSAPAANTVLTGTGSGTSGWATVSTAMIGDDQVTAAKIHDDAVTKVVVTDTADATCFPALFESATGSLTPETDAGLTYNASNATLTATTFVGALTGDASGSSGSCTGNAATATLAADATKLATARAINGVDFDGTAAITVTAAAGTLSGTELKAEVVTSSLTSVGTLGSLTVTGVIDANGVVKITDGSVGSPALTFDSDEDTGLFSETAGQINVTTAGTKRVTVDNTGNIYLDTSGGNYVALNPATGTGNDAEWALGYGVYSILRNSSTAAEKENISVDLGSHLTADMIDSVVPKMWNRITAPGYPEIGPIADEIDEVSPFLAAHGTDVDGDQILTGINKTAWMSLMTLALQDIRTRLAALEG